MQNCNGFAEAALRHYLIKATEHGSRAATSQLYWLFSGRPSSLSDIAHPPTHSGWRGSQGGRSALKMLPPHPPRQPLAYLIKAGAPWALGACGTLPEMPGSVPQMFYRGSETIKAARYSVILIPRPPGVVAPIIFRGLRPVA